MTWRLLSYSKMWITDAKLTQNRVSVMKSLQLTSLLSAVYRRHHTTVRYRSQGRRLLQSTSRLPVDRQHQQPHQPVVIVVISSSSSLSSSLLPDCVHSSAGLWRLFSARSIAVSAGHRPTLALYSTVDVVPGSPGFDPGWKNRTPRKIQSPWLFPPHHFWLSNRGWNDSEIQSWLYCMIRVAYKNVCLEFRVRSPKTCFHRRSQQFDCGDVPCSCLKFWRHFLVVSMLAIQNTPWTP